MQAPRIKPSGGIPIDVPGLSTIIPELAPNRILVAESAADPAKSFFVRHLGTSALRLGWSVTFVTTRDRNEVESRFAAEGEGPRAGAWAESLEIIERDSMDRLDALAERTGLMIFDSFSLLTLELQPLELARFLREIRTFCRRPGTAVILATDRGMSEPRSEAITLHLADGAIQFHSKEGPESLLRYLRIPKWMDTRFVDQNIYYDFDGRRIAIDLRRRVL
jgi:KaiC/GvpD/RAD55 family RecA-like ATPase